MGLLAAFCLCILCPVVLSAQVAPKDQSPPDLLILRHGQSLEIEWYVPRNWEHLPESQRRIYPAPSTAPGDYTGWPSTEGPRKVRRFRPIQLYSVELKNIGAKKIAGVIWEYVFTGSVDDKELVRLQFRTPLKIGVNKSATLRGKSLEPPRLPKVINVSELEKEGDPPYREHVEIKCVLYADKTWWRDTKVLLSDCDSLVNNKKRN